MQREIDIMMNISFQQRAQLELLNVVNGIQTEREFNEFRDVLAHYYATKAQQGIDALWDKGVINSETIEEWGNEHMRTPYRNAKNCS